MSDFDIIEIPIDYIIKETNKAYLIQIGESKDKDKQQEWIPKSQIQNLVDIENYMFLNDGSGVTLEIPE